MAEKKPFEWNVAIWRAEPLVTALSTLARGIYRELLDSMHELDHRGVITGTREELARHGRCPVVELDQTLQELRKNETCSVLERDGIVTLINRRMKREYEERQKTRERVAKHRSRSDSQPSTLNHQLSCNASVTLPYKNDKGDKALSPLSLETEGECKGETGGADVKRSGNAEVTPAEKRANTNSHRHASRVTRHSNGVVTPKKRLSNSQSALAKRFEIILGHQWPNDAGKWVNRIKNPETFKKSERVVAEVESALKENRIETTTAQYAEQIWKEFT